ncbi:MAG: hypothetical protein OEM15_15725 [Myxococcales bacterium]|nr:hypothetical protein [Myxococcales bacterium]
MTEANSNTDYRVGNDGFWARAWVAPLVLAGVGGLMAALTAGPERLGYAYLFALFTVVTFMLGGIFLVLIQFLTAAHWGVSTRRIVEVVMSGAPVVALLAAPLIFGVATGKVPIYQEWQGEGEHGAHHEGPSDEHGVLGLAASVAQAQGHEAGHEGDDAGHDEGHAHTAQETKLHHEVIEAKTGYLNTRSWTMRAIIYLLIWSVIALLYFGWSRRQDDDHDPKHTLRMQSLAAPLLIVFAGTLTFAAFDWLMSLEPSWFSTIFGVVIFAGSAVAILAATILIGLSLYKRGLVGEAINPVHFHDLAKLLFGFICFWTYVSFSQWMLIWYAGIPEEATWFHKRWGGGWMFVSYLLIFGHFVAPFLLLISRVQKLNLRWLQAMCLWVIFIHAVDIYWFVLPQAGAFRIQLADIGALLFVGGVFFAYVFWQLGRVPLIPVGDPRLQKSLHHYQTH